MKSRVKLSNAAVEIGERIRAGEPRKRDAFDETIAELERTFREHQDRRPRPRKLVESLTTNRSDKTARATLEVLKELRDLQTKQHDGEHRWKRWEIGVAASTVPVAWATFLIAVF